MAVGAGGGFDPVPRLAFAALAGGALTLAAREAPATTGRILRSPVVRLLLGFALLSALSTTWTTGLALEGLSWALAVAGCAALAVAGAVVCGRPGGLAFVVAAICAAAVLTAILGLVATVLEREPLALLLDGAWRPAGPFEYPPALALLQTIALPGLIWGTAELKGPLRVGAGGGLALALSVIVLSGSRLQLVLALLVLAAAGIGAYQKHFVSGRRALVVASSGLALLAVLAALALSPGQSNGGLGVDLTHGRIDTWSAAVETARERPWLGSGVETFELASASNQGGIAVRYAHNLPLDAWVELGVAGIALVLCLYAAVGLAVWRARGRPGGWLLGVGAIAFLVTNLADWSWHLAGLGAIWALCLGGVLACAPLSESARPS